MPGGRPFKYKTEEERKAANLERALKWRENNWDKYVENEKKRRIKSKSKIQANRKKWSSNNKEKIKEIRRKRATKRRKEDPIFKFKEITKNLISSSFTRRGKSKRIKTESILGCTIEYFQEYILSKCPEGVGLKDFGVFGYHLDHIIPISLAKTEEDVIKLCHYTNFQPLFWIDNIKKSNKIL